MKKKHLQDILKWGWTLNTGLTEEQKVFFLDNSVIIKEAIWNTPVPKFKILGRDNLKTQVARAYLPDYFEDYKLYIWLDADMWLNDMKSFNLVKITNKGIINITGVKKLNQANHKIMSDRIVAGTFVIAAVMLNKKFEVKDKAYTGSGFLYNSSL